MTEQERVAKRMFEAYRRGATYGDPWNGTSKSVQDAWLMIASEALDEIKSAGLIEAAEIAEEHAGKTAGGAQYALEDLAAALRASAAYRSGE